MNRTESIVIGLCLSAFAAWSFAQVHTMSIKGNRQVCTKGADQCVIFVSVAPSAAATGRCEAGVNMAHVVVRGDGPVTFQLAKTDMTDKNVYEFVPPGIQWGASDAASAGSEFNHSSTSAAQSAWKAASQAASTPLRSYVPTVRIVGKAASCAAGDPRINNDG